MGFLKSLFGDAQSASPLQSGDLFITRLTDHLKRVDALGGPHSAFVKDYFPREVVTMLAAAAADKMALTHADQKEHSFCISKPPVSYWICTIGLSIGDAKKWFGKVYGGYSKLLERAWSSDHFRGPGCEVLVHIVYGRAKKADWVNMTIFPIGRERFGFKPILPIDLLNETEKVQDDQWETLNAGVRLYYGEERYDHAIIVGKDALQVAEQAYGPNHPNIAVSLNNLAAVYRAQGQYAQAEPLYKRSLAIDETALGPDHPDVAQSLNNLAELYSAQGKYAQAELLYKRSLAISEKAFGPDHPTSATILNNLGSLYKTQSQYAQAELLYKRSLAIDETALGPDHPSVAASLNNLGLLYETQGQYAQAEPLLTRALAIVEKALGPDHPKVATTLVNMALLYRKTDREKTAEVLEKRAAAIKAIQR